MVVEHEQLVIRIILREQRARTRADVQRLVARGDEDGNARRIRAGGRLGGAQAAEGREVRDDARQREQEPGEDGELVERFEMRHRRWLLFIFPK